MRDKIDSLFDPTCYMANWVVILSSNSNDKMPKTPLCVGSEKRKKKQKYPHTYTYTLGCRLGQGCPARKNPGRVLA